MAKSNTAFMGLIALGAIGWATKDMWLPYITSSGQTSNRGKASLKKSSLNDLGPEEMIEKIGRINEGLKKLQWGTPEYLTLQQGLYELGTKLSKLGYAYSMATGTYKKIR